MLLVSTNDKDWASPFEAQIEISQNSMAPSEQEGEGALNLPCLAVKTRHSLSKPAILVEDKAIEYDTRTKDVTTRTCGLEHATDAFDMEYSNLYGREEGIFNN